MHEDSLKNILEQLSQSDFFRKKFDKEIKSKDDAQKILNECKNIEIYIKAIESKILDIESNLKADASFFLNKTNFHIQDPKNYMLFLEYFKLSTKKRKIANAKIINKEFRDLIKTFRKKNYEDRNTLTRYLKYTCPSGPAIKIDPTCGKVAPSSSQNYDLQRVSLDVFLEQFDTFKLAEKELFEMLKDYKEKLDLMTTLAMKCFNKYGGDWDALIKEETAKKEEKKIQQSTEGLHEEISLCLKMKNLENKYNVKIQLMFQAYKEYLKHG